MNNRYPNTRFSFLGLTILVIQILFVFGFTYVNKSNTDKCCHRDAPKPDQHSCCIEEASKPIADHCNQDVTSDELTLSDCNCVHKFIPITDYSIQKTFELTKFFSSVNYTIENYTEVNSFAKKYSDFSSKVHSPPIFIIHSAFLI